MLSKKKYYFDLLKKIKNKKINIGIIGVGYVGIKLLIEFGRLKIKLTAYDNDKKKINKLKKGFSPYSYISNTTINNLKSNVNFYSDLVNIKSCDVIIICLPTPIKQNTKPDLSAISSILLKLNKFLKKGQLIVLESTTYPGTTRELIGKRLTKDFIIGEDIFLGYSPEREDPGNKIKFKKISKVVSGYTHLCLELVKNLYKIIITKVVSAANLEEAELSKLLENIYRSVNIGLVNELKMIAKSMGIDINNVIKLSSTKPFGFQVFYPGPGVGGHCIPIDPYYLYWRAKKFGKEAKFVKLAGDINVETTKWITNNIIKLINLRAKVKFKKKILILGLAYKKNIEDIRESAAIKIIKLLSKENVIVHVSDPHVDFKSPTFRNKKSKNYLHNSKFIKINKKNLTKYDCVVLVTDHDLFDYKIIEKYSKIIVDTRNKIKRTENVHRF